MKKELDKEKYKNKISSYAEILKEYYPEPCEIYFLIREKKMSKLESTFDFFIGAGTVELADALNDMSPYYLVVKSNLKIYGEDHVILLICNINLYDKCISIRMYFWNNPHLVTIYCP